MLKIVKRREPSKPLTRVFRRSILAAALFASFSYADPWANAGDERTRFHIQVLKDAGKIQHPISTWPIMWVEVEASLADIDIKMLNNRELWSYRYLKHVTSRAKRALSGVKSAHIANSRSAVNDFATESRERSLLSSSITTNVESVSFKIQLNIFEKPLNISERQPDDSEGQPDTSEKFEKARVLRFDGSYLAGTRGNWVFGAGAIDRWWGPGWQSSLILSNNARPSPGLFIQRKQSLPSDWPLLSLLGPWNMHLFANQLEADREIANAKLVGARLTFQPLSFFEFGLSRVAQWGGEERPESWQSLADVILGNDDNADIDPGNQTLSFDWRLHLPLLHVIDLSLYNQQYSEDGEDFASDNANIWGLEASFLIAAVNTHLSYEYHDSRSSSDNGVYEHSIYSSGYRTHGRSIGSSLDTASLGRSLLGEHYFSNGHQLHWRYGKIKFNTDDTAGHPYGDTEIEETLVELRYKLPLSKTLQLNSGLQHLSEPLVYSGEVIESHLSIGFDFQW